MGRSQAALDLRVLAHNPAPVAAVAQATQQRLAQAAQAEFQAVAAVVADQLMPEAPQVQVATALAEKSG